MDHFPQISTECLAQFPIRKQQNYRTATTDAVDGLRFRAPDIDAAAVRWELTYRALTDEEKQRIENLFASSQGRLHSFVFVDPTANLLARADNLTGAQWVRGPLVIVSAGITDPVGGNDAWNIQNGSATAGCVSQAVACPPSLRYCFSVYLRSADSAPVECILRIRNAAGEVSTTASVRAEWTRAIVSASLPDASGPVTFELELPAGASVDAYGFQVDAQPSPSPYRPSVTGAVYPQTRFEDDVLRVRTDGPNNHAITIRLISRASR